MKEYLNTPINNLYTSVPSKIQGLNFKVVPSSPFDDDYLDFEFIELKFIKVGSDKSEAEMYLIEIKDLDTGIVKKYTQSITDKPYYYWQRTSEYISEQEYITEPVPNGIVNARVFITPINSYGSGPRSSFIVPLKDMNYITKETSNINPTSLILAKYWHLFSKNPDEIYNRPKVMHIYLDVDKNDILLDKAMFFDNEYRFDTIGTYEETNQEMFRWLVSDDYYKLDENDNFNLMLDEEKDFINNLIQSFLDLYRRDLSESGKASGDPHRFKISVENPADHSDSIIIYVLEGQRWQI